MIRLELEEHHVVVRMLLIGTLFEETVVISFFAVGTMILQRHTSSNGTIISDVELDAKKLYEEVNFRRLLIISQLTLKCSLD